MIDIQKFNPFLQLKARSVFIYFFLISIAVGFVAGLLASFTGFNMKDPIMNYVFYCLTFGLLCLWLLQRFRELQINPKYLIGNVPNNYQWLTIFCLVLAMLLFSVGAALLSFYFLSLVAPSFVQSLVKSLADESKTSAVPILYKFLEIVSLTIVAPLVEEFIFRGIILHRWATKWGIVPGILVSSIVFGFLHVNPLGLSVFGIVMALLYLRSNTLIVPIIAHSLNNTVVVLIQLLSSSSASKSTASYTDWRSGVVLVALSAPFLILFIYKKWPRPNISLPYFANASR